MRMTDVISIGKSYLSLGILCTAVVIVLIVLCYKIIYQKKMHGQKKLRWQRLLWLAVLICYLLVVCGATVLRRGDVYQEIAMQPLFASYREAWAEFSIRDWRNLILNILMFVPFGFLLPAGIRKLRIFWRTYLCGFVFTLCIELMQFTLANGIFEWDDILNNTLGTMIGYGIFVVYHAVVGCLYRNKYVAEARAIQKKTGKKEIYNLLCCQIPLILVCVSFAIVFFAYQKQEFGNLAIQFVANPKGINCQVQTTQEYSDAESEARVFLLEQLTQEDTKEITQEFLSRLGDTIDDPRTDLYDETAVYYSEKEKGFWMDYNGGTYSYTDFATLYADEDDETAPDKVTDADETKVRTVLETYGIQLPEAAVFQNDGDGNYSFSCAQLVSGQKIYDGTLNCQLYSNGKMGTIDNHMYEGTYVKNCPIISEKAAYSQIGQGKMRIYADAADSYDITVGKVQLIYQKDSKGYYQPVYQFDAVINGEETEILIAALKR